MPEDTHDSAMKNRIPDFILFLHFVFQVGAVASLLYGIHSGILAGKFIVLASIGTGLNSGSAGITAAHEMIHRRQAFFRRMGIINLLTVNYGHFYIEHVRGHHKYVGTPRDPATARYGESIYRFFSRTVWQQFRSAFRLEKKRLVKENHSGWSLRNFVISITIAELAIFFLVVSWLGAAAAAAFLLQSFVAIFLLEYVNYIEHYGLIRKEGQKVSPVHSWQSNSILSRFTLLELSRHSDHHCVAAKPYHTLISYDESPRLPNGYFGNFYTVLIPPLWFRFVHPILDEHLARNSMTTT